jgi:autotransporter-associated beta strand protein
MGSLTISGSRLKVSGTGGGTLDFSAASTITGSVVIDSTVTTAGVSFSNAIGGSGSLTKEGVGSLILGGVAANTYTGTTRVNAGTLLLNKQQATAVPGGLTVFTGGRVVWQAADQVADAATIGVNGSTSTMDLAGFNETVGGVTMSSGTIATNGGMLHLAGGVTTSSSSAVATMSGKLDLMLPQTPVNVADGVGTPADDLVISADITGVGGIDKQGPGVLVLSGNNSFAGAMTISGGSMRSTGGTTLSGTAALSVTTQNFDIQGTLNTTNGTKIMKDGAGALTIRGPQNHGASAEIDMSQGQLNMMSDSGSNSTRNLGIIATGGNVQLNSLTTDQHLRELTLRNGSNGSLVAGKHLLYIDALTLDNLSKLDLSDGRMIIKSGAAVGGFNGSSYSGITGLIASGRNGGAWNGKGVVTSQNTSGQFTTLGVVSADVVLRSSPTWAGVAVPDGAVLVAYTYGGDSNLDGKINIDDYTRIDSGVSAGLSGWSNGDFNYDGKVNIDDYTVIDSNIGIQGVSLGGSVSLTAGLATSSTSATQFVAGGDFRQATSLLPRSSSGGAGDSLDGVSAVPEPGSILAPALFGAGALIRRRRRRA